MIDRDSRRTLILCAAAFALAALPTAAQSVGVAPTQYPRPIMPPIVRPPVPNPVLVQPTQQVACATGDCVSYVLSTQDECAMFERQATGDGRWALGLSTSADSALFSERGQTGWDVTSYRIRWSNGAWSEWYVTGVNDLDHKYNPGPNTMRRMWSYFADHEHQALACHHR